MAFGVFVDTGVGVILHFFAQLFESLVGRVHEIVHDEGGSHAGIDENFGHRRVERKRVERAERRRHYDLDAFFRHDAAYPGDGGLSVLEVKCLRHHFGGGHSAEILF